MCRIDMKTGHVDLSLLPEDTGKGDIFPESLNLQPRLKGKEKEKYTMKKIHTGRKRKKSESKQVTDTDVFTPFIRVVAVFV